MRAARWARQRTRASLVFHLLEALRAVIPRRQSGSRCCSPRPIANQNGMVFTNTPTAFLEPSHGLTRHAGTRPSAAGKAEALVTSLEGRLGQARGRAAALKRHPRLYFEEWDEPMISGIGWVAELVEIAGGIDAFPALSQRKNAKERIVSAEDVISANPEIIVGSWCGKKFVPDKVAARPGFAKIVAVRDGFLREVKSPLILQPGPAALTDGLDALAAIIQEWAAGHSG